MAKRSRFVSPIVRKLNFFLAKRNLLLASDVYDSETNLVFCGDIKGVRFLKIAADTVCLNT